MKEELVSIVIPTYNRYETLIRAIDSSLNQTHQNLEVIVVDDNYKKPLLRKKIKNNLKNKYGNKIQLLFPNQHLDGADARNYGVSYAKGKYIAFLDDDDESLPLRIEKQLEIFHNNKDPKLGLVYCWGYIVYPNGYIEPEKIIIRGCPLVKQMYYNIAGTSFWLIRRDVLDDIGGFETVDSHQDGIILLKLLAKGYRIDLSEEFLINYYPHPKLEGKTGVNHKTLIADLEYLNKCKKYFHLITAKEQKKVLCKYYDDRNWNLIILNKKKDAFKDLGYMFKHNFFTKYFYKCLFRIIFSDYVANKEKKFDEKYLLVGDKNGK